MKKRDIEVHAYLSGPDVFYPDTLTIADSKKAIAAKHGIIAHYPSDVVIPEELGKRSFQEARRDYIAGENEQLMDDCCEKGKIGVILVNLDAFRGANMDDGTAAEAGYIRGYTKIHPNKDNIFVIGYRDKDHRTFKERLADYHRKMDGKEPEFKMDPVFKLPRDPAGFMVDDTQYVTSMVEYAIAQSGGKICGSFEEACELARKLADERIKVLNSPERYKGNGGKTSDQVTATPPRG